MHNYKKCSLEQLENWIYDSMGSEATAQEIYNTIKNVVQDNYHTYKKSTSEAYELLALLNGNGKETWDDVVSNVFRSETKLKCDKDDQSSECKGAWNDFWEENYYPEEHHMPPWGHSDLEYGLNNFTKVDGYSVDGQNYSKYWYEYDRNDSNKPNPFDKNTGKTLSYDESIAAGWEMTDDGFWIKGDKVTKWVLPVEYIDDEYFVSFPDDLLESTNLKEGDQIEWIDNKDGSYTLRKVIKPLGMDEC